MKILMMSDNLVKGGRERRLIELLKGLTPSPENQVHLLLLSDQIAYPEVHKLPVKIHTLGRGGRRDAGMFLRVYRLLKEVKPDLIHCWGSLSSVVGLPAARVLGIPFINATIADAPAHVGLTHKHFMRSRFTFPFSDAIVGNSYAGLKSYRAPEQKSYCMHNGFDFNRIAWLENETLIREKFGIQTPRVIGMVGAFEERKDYATYIRSAIEIVSRRNDVSFMAIGGGVLLDACKAMVPEPLQSRIIFTGVQNQVESIMNIMDAGVLTTNPDQHGEGISNAILEFMALGKPVVATDGGGTGEIVVDGETGFLVPGKQVAPLTERMEWLLDHPTEAARMGEAGHQRVFDSFNLRDMVDKYVRLYHKVLGTQAVSA